jgi:hypothetical protein
VGSTKNFQKFVFRTTKEKCVLLGRPIPTREALRYSTFRSDVKDIFFKNSKNSIYSIFRSDVKDIFFVNSKNSISKLIFFNSENNNMFI